MNYKLKRVEGGVALPIDPEWLRSMGIDEQTPLRVTVEGDRLVVQAAEQDAFERIVRETGEANAELFRRLAR